MDRSRDNFSLFSDAPGLPALRGGRWTGRCRRRVSPADERSRRSARCRARSLAAYGEWLKMNRNTIMPCKMLRVAIAAVTVLFVIGVDRVGAADGERPASAVASADSTAPKRTRATGRSRGAASARDGQTATTTRRANEGAALRGRAVNMVPIDGAGSPAASGQTAGTSCVQPAENCQAGDTVDALVSNRTEFLIADDFRPLASGSITEICWRGVYGAGVPLVDCQGDNPDTFEVKYYSDVGGVPGALLASFSQSGGDLTVVGPALTGAIVAGVLPEYEFSATHDPVSVAAGECHWVEISNDTGTCTWFWEVSAQGDDWAMQDGDPPDVYDLAEFVLRDLAFCLNLELSPGLPCGPPDNAACPGTPDCCSTEVPVGTPGCDDELCCERVCACDPFCCTDWDPFCATTGVNDNGCGAQLLCAQECSFCGAPTAGECCEADDPPTPSCTDATCCDAVCACDP